MKKIISITALIFVFSVLLTCAVSAGYIAENDCYVYTVKELINSGLGANGDLSFTPTLDYDNRGNDTATFTVSDDGKFDGSFYATMSLPDKIIATNYPIMVMGYTNNIVYDKAYADSNHGGETMPVNYKWAISYNLNTTTGEVKRFWGPRGDMTADGEEYKTSVNFEDITAGDDNAKPEDIKSDSHILSIRFLPFTETPNWNTALPVLETDTYFTVKYVAFFKTQAEADAFTFNKDDYIVSPKRIDRALMFPESENGALRFRPTDQLTRAEAATAIASQLIDLSTIKGRYTNNFSDITSNTQLYDVVGYLLSKNIIKNSNTFNPDNAITQETLSEWIGTAGFAYSETVTTGDTITRGAAAKVFCDSFGRTPKADSFSQTSIGFFSDISREIDNFEYIIEVSYEHGTVFDDKGYEQWLSAKDPYFYMVKTDESYIKTLESNFETKREAILTSESEWATNSYYATNGSKGDIFYISNSGEDSLARGKNQKQPLATYEYLVQNKSSFNFGAGDVVLFERGSSWHMGTMTGYESAKYRFLNGVTYSAYGEGDKPKLYGSIQANDPNMWIQIGDTNVYKYNMELDIDADVGNIVFTPKTALKDTDYAAEYQTYRPVEAKKLYGQRIIRNLISESILTTGLDKLVGNGKDTWILDHETLTFPFANATIGENFNTLVSEIKKDNPGKTPNLIYFHAWKDDDRIIINDEENTITSIDGGKAFYGEGANDYISCQGYVEGDDHLYLYCEGGNPADLYDIEICTYGDIIEPGQSNNITIDNLAILCGGSHGVGAGSSTNLIVRNCEVGWIGGSVQNCTPTVKSGKITEWSLTRYGNSVEIFGSADNYQIKNCYMYQAFDCGPTVQWQGIPGDGVTSNVVVEKNIVFENNVLWDADLEVWMTSSVANTAATEQEAQTILH